MSRLTLPLAALMLVGCSGGTDPRVAKIAAQTAPPAATVEQAKDPRFDEFRKICRKEREATTALSAFRRSVGKRALTPDEVGTFDSLMSAVKPFAEAVSEWFEREDLTDKDRVALRYIHDVEVANEPIGTTSAPLGQP